MKNYRFLVPIVLIVALAASFYMLISNDAEDRAQYNMYLEKARSSAANGITKAAIENYNKAKTIYDTIELDIEIAEYYKTHEKPREYMTCCEEIYKKYPKDVKAYEIMLTAYYNEKNYKSCFDVLEGAEKRRLSNEKIEEISDAIKYEYQLDYNTYNTVREYQYGYCAVKKEEYWGYVNRFGSQNTTAKYKNVNEYNGQGYAPVTDKNGEVYFIDADGDKATPTFEGAKQAGVLIDNRTAVQMGNEKYVYMNMEGKQLFDQEFDYASAMNESISAVKSGDKWRLFNAEGNSFGDEYDDVILDESGIACRNKRLFVKQGDEYHLINESGNRVGELSFQDAKLFRGDCPTPVKIDDQWCFIDTNGNLISDKKYDDAMPFFFDLAGVCIDGKWGFVDKDENVVIEPQFSGTKCFNGKGSCFVNTGSAWQLLKLYRLNR